MNCTDVSDLVSVYLSGELESVRAQQIAAHVQVCSSCAHELEQQQRFDGLLRQSVRAERFDSSRLEGSVRRVIAKSSQRRELRRWIFGVAAVAAMMLLIAGIRIASSSRTVPVYAAAARDHRLEVVNVLPRKWFADRASIEALAGRQRISGSLLDAIVPTGYHLAKGKLCRLDGKVFLHLVYVNDSGNFSVFLRPSDAPGTLHTEVQGKEYIAGFQNARLSALIVTEQPGDAALRFAQSAAAVI